MTLSTIDRRSHDVIELPRHRVAEDWMDVNVLAFETRRDLGRAYKARVTDPRPALYAADAKLIRLEQFARRRAGEAAGIGFIAPGQELLFPDGCGPEGSVA